MSSTDLLARIAYLYYKKNFTQQQIATQEGLSRPKVVRLLQEAHRTGIVRIEIVQDLPAEQKEAYDLQSLFGLQRVIIVRSEETRVGTVTAIRNAVANLITANLKEMKSIGFSFSRTMGNIADYIHTNTGGYDGAVCDLMGAMLGFPMPYTASADVAKRIGGTLYPITAPIMVMDPGAMGTYFNDPVLKRSMSVAESVELAIVGIGDFTTQNILFQSGYINEETINNMRRQGIVGEICMRFFNLNGDVVDTELDARVISVPWKSLANTKQLIAVASGSDKIRTILGALKTGVIDTLVSDLETVRNVLRLHQQL